MCGYSNTGPQVGVSVNPVLVSNNNIDFSFQRIRHVAK